MHFCTTEIVRMGYDRHCFVRHMTDPRLHRVEQRQQPAALCGK
jgi:hypothetical protein